LIVFRFPDAEEPPAGLLLSATGLSFEIDFQNVSGRRDDLEPVLADIPLGAAVAALPGFAPGLKDNGDLDRLVSPDKFPGHAGFPDGHPRGVAGGNHGNDGFTDKPLRHDQFTPGPTVEGCFR